MQIARAVPDLMHRQMIPMAVGLSADCDCDCSLSLDATPLSHFVPHLPTTPYGSLQRVPGLHREQLSHGQELIFNPLSSAGVIVLSKRAARLLDSFGTPQPFSAAWQDPNLSFAYNMVEQLVAFELLADLNHPPTPTFQEPQVLSAWLHVTNACNLRCSYCYIRKAAEGMSPEIGRRSIDMLFDAAQRYGFSHLKLKYSGGEALLNLRLILTLHAYARERAAATSISLQSVILSNGIAISSHTAKNLREQGIGVSISLDGIGAYNDAHRSLIHGGGSFIHIQRAIRTLIEHGLSPTIAITVTDHSLEGLPSLFNALLDDNLPFTLSFYRENDYSACQTDLQAGETRMIEVLLSAMRQIERRIPRRSLLGSLVDKANFLAAHERTCAAGNNYMVIDQYGQVAKCQMEIEKPITTIFADDPLAILSKTQMGLQSVPVDAKEGCRTCTWRYWCAGGCPVQTYRATGRYDIRSPNCAIYKALIPAMLRLEGMRIAKYASECYSSDY